MAAVALLPLHTPPRRAALFLYPEAPPNAPEREALGRFAELIVDAGTACTPTPNDLAESNSAGRLIEVVQSIASPLTLSETLRVVAQQTSQLLNADRSSVWIHDAEADEIYTLAAQKLDADEIRMPDDQGLAGHVLHTGTPINLTDAYDHSAFDPSHDRQTGYRTRSMLCLPLRNRQGDVLGVFQVINKQDEDAFTATDEALLETLAGSAAVAIENAMLYEAQQLQFESFIQVLATTIDSRDPTTGQHTVMVTGLAVLLAEELGLSDAAVEKLRVAGILHDVGKIVLPDEVLLKKGDLTDEEYEIIKSHAEHTLRILENIHFHRDLDDIPEIAGAHHERLDGDGYPQGLSADDLTVPMRILAVADVFHALIQDRPYKDSFSIEEAVAECRRVAGSTPHPPADERAHLDPTVVEALVQHLEREGTDTLRDRLVDRSGFKAENVFDPDQNLPG
jgi:putative nucleotidyltransferase with HDIG domain